MFQRLAFVLVVLFMCCPGMSVAGDGRCLEKLNFQQILAMIDKRYANHREVFKNPMSTEMIEAVTVTGSPCEGITASKNPTVLWALPGRKTTR
jgi:hypothetical protein